MDKILKIGHYYNSGDLITILPGLRSLFKKKGIKTEIYQRIGLKREEHILKDDNGDFVSMTIGMFEKLKPLLESQEYISELKVWKGELVDWDFAKTRDSRIIPLPYSDIHFWPFFCFPELQCDLSIPWISVQNGVSNQNIIINRTSRYQNPYIQYYFLKDYKNLIFAGTEKERNDFCKDWELDMPLLQVEDFHELAFQIKSCKLFIGNQSFCWHLADAMKVPRVLEICPGFPNTVPTGRDGYADLYQQGLELHIKELSE